LWAQGRNGGFGDDRRPSDFRASFQQQPVVFVASLGICIGIGDEPASTVMCIFRYLIAMSFETSSEQSTHISDFIQSPCYCSSSFQPHRQHLSTLLHLQQTAPNRHCDTVGLLGSRTIGASIPRAGVLYILTRQPWHHRGTASLMANREPPHTS
jgi:hypothetical protein